MVYRIYVEKKQGLQTEADGLRACLLYTSCGIVVNDEGVFTYHKDGGLVNDVFTPCLLYTSKCSSMYFSPFFCLHGCYIFLYKLSRCV